MDDRKLENFAPSLDAEYQRMFSDPVTAYHQLPPDTQRQIRQLWAEAAENTQFRPEWRQEFRELLQRVGGQGTAELRQSPPEQADKGSC